MLAKTPKLAYYAVILIKNEGDREYGKIVQKMVDEE